MLTRDFYQNNANEVAKQLLGKVLCRRRPSGILRGRIVETEAYIGAIDKASHAYPDVRTNRTEVMYGIGGKAYIYLIYGMYHCLNFVTGPEEQAQAVLIRALEPLNFFELLEERMNQTDRRKLLNGPGKLCKGFSITRELNAADLCADGPLWVEDDGFSDYTVACGKRIGIDYAEEARDFLWRYGIKDSPYLSKKMDYLQKGARQH